MKRVIEVFKGREISNEKIAKLRKITATRYAGPIYDSSYWSLENVDFLAFIHDVNVDDEIIILGEDWFLCRAYAFRD